MVSENLARELWGSRRRRSANGFARTPRALARSRRRRQRRCATTGVNKKAPTVAYWPLLMDEFRRERRRSIVRRDACRIVIRSRRTGAERVRRRSRARGLVGQPEPAAGRRPHAARRSTSTSMARTSFTLVMLAIAGGDGAAARRRRDLRRDLLLGVAAHARDRHPHRARRAGAGGHAACSSATA